MQIIKKGPSIIITETLDINEWAHLGMIQGPPDYESGKGLNGGFWPKSKIVLKIS